MPDEAAEIARKLDIIIRMLAYPLTIEKTAAESIILLNKIGLDNKEIVTITGASPQTVANRISESKKPTNKPNSK